MTTLNIDAKIDVRKLVRPFIISTGARTHQPVVSVTLSDGHFIGRGEATGIAYRGETAETVLAHIKSLSAIPNLTREILPDHLPSGGAMSAMDAALWELEAARKGTTVSKLIGVDPKPVASAFTIVLDTPAMMAEQTRDEAWRPLLKVKLGGAGEFEAARMKAVRAAAPRAQLVIDANAGWTPQQLSSLAPVAKELGYELIEQPLPMGCETHAAMRAALKRASEILPLCADESFQTIDDLDRCAPSYDFINIKLDKCGGLTAALAIRDAAKSRGLGVFIGCMVAPTIAVAPAHLLAQTADYADLDGPFWFPGEPVQLNSDGLFQPISPAVWGQGASHAKD